MSHEVQPVRSTADALKADYYSSAGVMQAPPAVLAKLAMRESLTSDSAKLVLAMVGLPARGKSFISHKLEQFLNWSGNRTQIFNAGQKRRREDSPSAPTMGRTRSNADFFDASNKDAGAMREQIAMNTLDELLEWFEEDRGEVGIFDATNSTRTRRQAVVERCTQAGARVVFIESICDEQALLDANMLAKVRASPDFKGLSEDSALDDLRKRIENYERAYDTIADDEGAYIKLYNLSSKVCANQVFGRMSTRVLPYLTALHIRPRPVYLAALPPGDGEASLDNTFALKLSAWVRAAADGRPGGVARLRLLSSTQPAAIAAAETVARGGGVSSTTHQSGLNPIDRGARDFGGSGKLDEAAQAGMSFHERFAGGGESFADLVRRLEPCLLEIEASMEPVLVLAHSGPCRALRAYFMGCAVEKVMGKASSPGACALANTGHKLVELVPMVAGGFSENILDLESGSGEAAGGSTVG